MESIRCGKCSRLLARASGGTIEIKCPRCGTLNHIRAESLKPERQAGNAGSHTDCAKRAGASIMENDANGSATEPPSR